MKIVYKQIHGSDKGGRETPTPSHIPHIFFKKEKKTL